MSTFIKYHIQEKTQQPFSLSIKIQLQRLEPFTLLMRAYICKKQVSYKIENRRYFELLVEYYHELEMIFNALYHADFLKPQQNKSPSSRQKYDDITAVAYRQQLQSMGRQKCYYHFCSKIYQMHACIKVLLEYFELDPAWQELSHLLIATEEQVALLSMLVETSAIEHANFYEAK